MDDASLLAEFELERVLLEDSKSKSIAVLGTIRGDHAILSAEKTAFDKNDLENLLQPDDIATDVQNNVYHKIFVNLKSELPLRPSAKYTLIYPATDTHIRKYTPQKRHMVEETPELYETIVRPYINTMTGKRLEWVYNILDHKAESDRIVFEDADEQKGFVMLPDLKWDGKTLSALYFLCIVHRRDLHSLRDLTGEHIDLLTHIRAAAKQAVCAKYELRSSQLRLYIHYQPSYYHLHIHVQTCDYEAGEGLSAGKAVLLDDVIEALRIDSAILQKRILYYTLGDESELYQLMMKAGSETP